MATKLRLCLVRVHKNDAGSFPENNLLAFGKVIIVMGESYMRFLSISENRNMPFCPICTFDANGHVVGATKYFLNKTVATRLIALIQAPSPPEF